MPEAILLIVYLGMLAVIAVIDLRTLRAPNRLVVPALLLVLVGAVIRSGSAPREAVLGTLVAFALLALVAALGRGAMGMGDVKYGAVCGAVVGVGSVLPMLAFTFASGGLVALAVLGLRIRGRKDVVAFTPFLFVGVIFALLWSDPYVVSA